VLSVFDNQPLGFVRERRRLSAAGVQRIEAVEDGRHSSSFDMALRELAAGGVAVAPVWTRGVEHASAAQAHDTDSRSVEPIDRGSITPGNRTE
jgi:hypothetical protein